MSTRKGLVDKNEHFWPQNGDENVSRHQKSKFPPKIDLLPQKREISSQPKNSYSLVSVSSINLSLSLLADRAPLNIPAFVGLAVYRLVRQHDRRYGQMAQIHNV